MSEILERRYRLLLYAFPARHRRQYREEMLGVLLDRARPGQRRPTVAEAADLLAAAASIRVRALRAAVTDDRWQAAAAVFGTIATVLLASLGLRDIAADIGWAVIADRWNGRPPFELFRDLAWLAPLSAIPLGWRTGAATMAWIATLTEATVLADNYRSLPTDLLHGLRTLTLALLASVALTLSVRHRPGPRLLGRWSGAALLAGGLLIVATSAAQTLQIEVHTLPDGRTAYMLTAERLLWSAPRLYGDPVVAALHLAAAAALLVVLARLAGPVRRRVLAASLPIIALYIVVGRGFTDYTMAAYHHTPPLPLGAGQWFLLGLTPLAALALGIALVHGYERRRPQAP